MMCHTMESENLEFCLWCEQVTSRAGVELEKQQKEGECPGPHLGLPLTGCWAVVPRPCSTKGKTAKRKRKGKCKEWSPPRKYRCSSQLCHHGSYLLFLFCFSMANDVYTAHVNGDSDPINPLNCLQCYHRAKSTCVFLLTFLDLPAFEMDSPPSHLSPIWNAFSCLPQ